MNTLDPELHVAVLARDPADPRGERGDVVRLTLSGERDLATGDRFQQHVREALNPPARKPARS